MTELKTVTTESLRRGKILQVVLERPATDPLYSQVYQSIRTSILSKRLSPGRDCHPHDAWRVTSASPEAQSFKHSSNCGRKVTSNRFEGPPE